MSSPMIMMMLGFLEPSIRFLHLCTGSLLHAQCDRMLVKSVYPVVHCVLSIAPPKHVHTL